MHITKLATDCSPQVTLMEMDTETMDMERNTTELYFIACFRDNYLNNRIVFKMQYIERLTHTKALINQLHEHPSSSVEVSSYVIS